MSDIQNKEIPSLDLLALITTDRNMGDASVAVRMYESYCQITASDIARTVAIQLLYEANAFGDRSVVITLTNKSFHQVHMTTVEIVARLGFNITPGFEDLIEMVVLEVRDICGFE